MPVSYVSSLLKFVDGYNYPDQGYRIKSESFRISQPASCSGGYFISIRRIMKRNLAGMSLLLFGISVLLLIGLTLSEAELLGMSARAERLMTFGLLVLPAGIGAGLGVMSLMRREGRTWLAAAGILLNTLFALFHLMVILFAG
jgi:hypothetical protein